MRSFALSLALVTSASCSAVPETGAPEVLAVTPPMSCRAGGPSLHQLQGHGFAPFVVNTATGQPELVLPEVSLERVRALDGAPLDGAPLALPEGRLSWVSPEEMTLEIAPDLGLDEGLYSVTVENPEGEEARLDPAYAVVPPPVLDSVSPAIVCAHDGDAVVVARGQNIGAAPTSPPTLVLAGRAFAADAWSDCTGLGSDEFAARLCREVRVPISASDIPDGSYAARVLSAGALSCGSTESASLRLVPPPVVTSINPPVLSGNGRIRLRGTGFVDLDGALPEIVIGDETFSPEFVSDCKPMADVTGSVQICNELRVEIPDGTLPRGEHPVSVRNPVGCVSAEAATLRVNRGD